MVQHLPNLRLNRGIFILLISIVYFSCKSEKQKETVLASFPTIEISKILEDSISIRALDYKDGRYWFAGNNGKYGFKHIFTDALKTYQIKVENDLEFRSIAVTSKYTFVLTAGNPALVYKISHDNDSVQLVYKERGQNVFYDSMKFWNDKEGIALGDPKNGCFSIIKTVDGGNTWQKVKCEKSPNSLPGEAAFAASNSNLKLLKNRVWFVTGGLHSRVFHSDDKGLNWRTFRTPITYGEQMTGIYATDFYDNDLGVIIGGDWKNKDSQQHNKAITRDGGQTWHLISNGSGPGYCSDVIFIPDTQGSELLAVGSPGIWWSGNQGQNWTKLSDEGFYTVHMTNANEGYFAGKNKLSKFKLLR